MKRSDHSWAAAFWEEHGELVEENEAGEKSAIVLARCLLCPEPPNDTVKKYQTPRHKSKAWEHTRRFHGDYNINELGTTTDSTRGWH